MPALPPPCVWRDRRTCRAQGDVLEDVKFARRIKAHRLRLRMADGNGLVSCRMYRDWPGVRDGYAKNILSGYGGSIFFLALATIFHWLVFLWPWGRLQIADCALRIADCRSRISCYAHPASPDCALQIPHSIFQIPDFWCSAGLCCWSAGIGLRAVTAWFTQRVRDALLMPVSVLLMTVIAAKSAYWQIRYGGPVWKEEW